MMRSHPYFELFILAAASLVVSSSETSDETFASSSRRLDVPVVRVNIPKHFRGLEKKEVGGEVIQKEDPSDVEEFPVNEGQFYEGGNPNNNNPNGYNPYDTNNGVNPLYPTGGIVPAGSADLEAFTARKAIDVELFPGSKIQFFDTVTRLGSGWNNFTSEFTCNVPGIFFFTFTACGESYRHFRITLRHNEVGVVSAYGDLNGYQMGSNSAVLRLLPGDRVYLTLDEGGIYEVSTLTGRAYNTFTGFRIL